MEYSYPEIGVKIYLTEDFVATGSYACLDLDWTVARPIRSIHPTGPQDLVLLPGRRETLTQWVQDGWSLVFFTNQRVNFFDARIKYFLSILKLPVLIFISYQENMYRKPQIGMFKLFKRMVPSIDQIFYCGDAGGRPCLDWSDTDLKFAQKAKIKFFTPQELFPPELPDLPLDHVCVVLVGPPGIGKSTFYQQHLSSFVHASSDAVKSNWNKLSKIIVNAMLTGKNVCVDATNGTQERREMWYRLAHEYHYQIYTIWMLGDSTERNKCREKKVPEIAIRKYWSTFEPPTVENTPGMLIEYY